MVKFSHEILTADEQKEWVERATLHGKKMRSKSAKPRIKVVCRRLKRNPCIIRIAGQKKNTVKKQSTRERLEMRMKQLSRKNKKSKPLF